MFDFLKQLLPLAIFVYLASSMMRVDIGLSLVIYGLMLFSMPMLERRFGMQVPLRPAATTWFLYTWLQGIDGLPTGTFKLGLFVSALIYLLCLSVLYIPGVMSKLAQGLEKIEGQSVGLIVLVFLIDFVWIFGRRSYSALTSTEIWLLLAVMAVIGLLIFLLKRWKKLPLKLRGKGKSFDLRSKINEFVVELKTNPSLKNLVLLLLLLMAVGLSVIFFIRLMTFKQVSDWEVKQIQAVWLFVFFAVMAVYETIVSVLLATKEQSPDEIAEQMRKTLTLATVVALVGAVFCLPLPSAYGEITLARDGRRDTSQLKLGLGLIMLSLVAGIMIFLRTAWPFVMLVFFVWALWKNLRLILLDVWAVVFLLVTMAMTIWLNGLSLWQIPAALIGIVILLLQAGANKIKRSVTK